MSRSRVLALAVLALVVAAPAEVGDATRSSNQWTWRSLHRPLKVPRIAPGAPCPTSALRRVDLGAQGVRYLPGQGPAFPNFGTRGQPLLEFYYPPLPNQKDFYGTGWSGNKVLWWVRGTYEGPVLIRGRQVDGPHLLRFDRGSPPPLELRIQPGRGRAAWKGARDRPSYTRVEAPGCYGYQIDGIRFTRVIFFEARVSSPPSQP